MPNGCAGLFNHAVPTLDLNGVEDTDDTESASWADMVEKEEEDRRIFNLTGRDPSRALIIHERLSSPSRTRYGRLVCLHKSYKGIGRIVIAALISSYD